MTTAGSHDDRAPRAGLGLPAGEAMGARLEWEHDEFFHGWWGGVGSTGTVVGVWHVVSRGCSPAEAIQRIAAARRGTMKGERPSPETAMQIEAIREAAARRQGC